MLEKQQKHTKKNEFKEKMECLRKIDRTREPSPCLLDGAPFEVDMRVRLVEETPGQGADNVLYYFTPEEILTIERVGTTPPKSGLHETQRGSEEMPTLGADTASPTDERRALTGESETMPTPNGRVTQNPADVKPEGGDGSPSEQEILRQLARSMAWGLVQEYGPDGLVKAIPQRPVQQSPQEILSRLAWEMAMDPQTRAIPMRPVQPSPQEILSRLAWEMTQDPTTPPASLSDEDLRAMLDEIARGQGGAIMELTEQARDTQDTVTSKSASKLIQGGEVFDFKGAAQSLIKRLENLPQVVDNVDVIRYYAENTALEETPDMDCPIAYDRISDVIRYNLNLPLPSGMDRDGLFLHELAHRADILMYSASTNTDWQNAVKQTKLIMEAHKAEIESWFMKGGRYEDDAFISDIVSAIFKGDIDVPYSHSPEYWKGPLAAELEIFANLLAVETLQTSGSQEIAGYLEVLHNTFQKIILGGII